MATLGRISEQRYRNGTCSLSTRTVDRKLPINKYIFTCSAYDNRARDDKSNLGESALSWAHVRGILGLAFAQATTEGERKRQGTQNSTHMGKRLADPPT